MSNSTAKNCAASAAPTPRPQKIARPHKTQDTLGKSQRLGLSRAEKLAKAFFDNRKEGEGDQTPEAPTVEKVLEALLEIKNW